MVPNKLVYSGNFFLEHERVYTRLLGRPEYVYLFEPCCTLLYLAVPCCTLLTFLDLFGPSVFDLHFDT